MVRCQPNLQRVDEPLNKKEKKLFAKLLPQYTAVGHFLSLYMPSGKPPLSLEEFVQYGQPVRMFRGPGESFLLTSANEEKHELGRTEKGSFAWTLYNWLRTLDLVDDVYQENSTSFILKERTIRVFYPVRIRSLSVDGVRKILISEMRKRHERVSVFFIPELLSTICATEGIPKLEFLSKLVDLYRTDPIHFHLEMMSSLRGDRRGPAYYKYLNFPEVRGVLRSHVCVSLKDAKDVK